MAILAFVRRLRGHGAVNEKVVEWIQWLGRHRARARHSRQQEIAQLATDGGFYWLHTDHLGTPRKMTNSSGVTVFRGEYDPHGNPLLVWSVIGNPYLNNKKFTGYERDYAAGLDFAQARHYKYGRGRFMQPDPAGLEAAELKVPRTLNRYSYVINDPINYIDKTGKFLGNPWCNQIYWNGLFIGWSSLLPGNSCGGGFIDALLGDMPLSPFESGGGSPQPWAIPSCGAVLPTDQGEKEAIAVTLHEHTNFWNLGKQEFNDEGTARDSGRIITWDTLVLENTYFLLAISNEAKRQNKSWHDLLANTSYLMSTESTAKENLDSALRMIATAMASEYSMECQYLKMAIGNLNHFRMFGANPNSPNIDHWLGLTRRPVTYPGYYRVGDTRFFAWKDKH